MTVCDHEHGRLTDPAGVVHSHTVEVDGIPFSALIAEAPRPRAVIVAIHGGAASSAYFDCPDQPWLSAVHTAARVGFTMLALDRPGYGASASHADTITTSQHVVDLAYAAVDAHLDGLPKGAGTFLMAHSMGCELATRMAADDRGRDLLGLELAGTGRRHHPVVLGARDRIRQVAQQSGRTTGAESLRRLLWQPAHLYPANVVGGAAIGSRSPAYEYAVARTWQDEFARVAAQVRIPVQYTLGDHERVWQSGQSGLADIASLFTASPRVIVNEQVRSGHNISVGLSAMAYHLKVLAFVEECVVAREQWIEGEGL